LDINGFISNAIYEHWSNTSGKEVLVEVASSFRLLAYKHTCDTCVGDYDGFEIQNNPKCNMIKIINEDSFT